MNGPNLSHNQGLLLTILLAGSLIVIHFHALISSLDTTISLEPYRDGLKTPVNAAFHAVYGESPGIYSGMNYPYKEHIVASTELPGMAIALNLMHTFFPHIHEYVFGISHIILLVSILLGAIFLYLILSRLKLPVWYAVLVSIGLTFLAPQHFRMFPHMGLAPVFVIPSILYGLLLFEEKPRWSVSFFIAILVIISSLLHFYFFAITIFTIGLYCLFSLARNYSYKRLLNSGLHFSIMALLPLAFFYFWMIANDPVTDRSPKPWGFLHYNAKWESIFLSIHLPLYQWIDKHIIKIESTDFEGWSYIGMVAGIFVITTFFRWVGRKFKHPVLDYFSPGEKQYYYPLLWTGVVLAVLACSQPFRTKGFEFLLDYTGPLQQFRSTGRFAWVFYFAINIVAFSAIYRFAASRKLFTKAMILSTSMALLAYEAYTLFTNKKIYSEDKFHQIEELLPGKRFTDIPGIDYSKYQAIIPIPYYNVGSNNFWSAGGGLSVQKSLVLSMQTGLPVTGAMLTRSSRRQCFDQMQLVTQPYRRPKVFDDYPNDKPLLILYSQPATEEEKRRHDHLIIGANKLHEGNGWTLYETEIQDFTDRIEAAKQSIICEMEERKLTPDGSLLKSYKESGIVYENFDSLKNSKAYFGNGCYEGDIRQPNILWSEPIPNAISGGSYHMLCWIYTDEDLYASTSMTIKEEDDNSGKIAEITYGLSWQAESYDPKGWVLVECPFVLNNAANRIIVTLQLKERAEGRLYADELLLKPVISDVYKKSPDFCWKNGRHFFLK